MWIWRSRVNNICNKAVKVTLYISYITATIVMITVLFEEPGVDRFIDMLTLPFAFFAIITIYSFAVIGLVMGIERLAGYLFRNRAAIASEANSVTKDAVVVGKDAIQDAASWIKSGFDDQMPAPNPTDKPKNTE